MNNSERFTPAGVAIPNGKALPLPVIAFDLARLIIRDMIKTHFEDDSCAASAAFTERILTGMGVDVEVVPCHTICFNRPYMAWGAQAGKLIPQTPEDFEQVHALGGRIVIMSGKPERAEDVHTLAGAFAYSAMPDDQANRENRFPGHIVVIAKTSLGNMLIDLSIDQVQNTISNMQAFPIVLSIDSRFEEPGDILVINNNHVITLYERIEDQSFRDSPDYRLFSGDDTTFNRIVSALEDSMYKFVSTLRASLQDNSPVRSLPSSAAAREVIMEPGNSIFRYDLHSLKEDKGDG